MDTPITELNGVGKKTGPKLIDLGLATVGKLAELTDTDMQTYVCKMIVEGVRRVNLWNLRDNARELLATGVPDVDPESEDDPDAPTAFDYFNDPDVLGTTPVEESRENEYIDQLAYAFQYGGDLLSFLKSTGLKMPAGFTLDTATADVDFNALLSGLAHVRYPVSYHEAAKLLDLEHDHEFYHVTVNELLFSIL
ncbi:hypothetical protein CYMTET_55553 [Cymbomonas tetramitiformis]|uniref:Uncharacterized protein n=1 Tax=Cymbomonas tetramitiformis TaxID=36881 RepID=A0AAE0BE41_9CHLO|nr:hypothetical protein CYMTET_55553 [Cymbomonas tetramitiformis]